MPHLLSILSFAGTSDTIRMSDEIMVVSQLSRSIAGMSSSVEVGAIFGKVVDFFREFDKRTPNPHPEWHF